MKKLLFVLLCGLLLFSGCGMKNSFDIGNKSSVEVLDKYVTFEFDDETITSEGGTVIFRNNSDYNVSYGTPYELEIKQDGEWHSINVELFFTMPLMSLKPGESENIEYNWAESYGELAPGEYRLIKNITVEAPTPESFYVAAEFVITE